jgi:Wadjet protein JetD, C-terminal
VSSDLIGGLRTQLARDAAMRSLVEAILDRCDRTGSMPGQITLPGRSSAHAEAARSLFSAAAVRMTAGGSIHIDLARTDARLRTEGGPGLAQVLYAAAGRPPRSLRAEAAALGAATARTAADLERRRTGAAARFLCETAVRLASCRGEFFALAQSKGIGKVEEELDTLALCIELAERNEAPVRLANFARRATGSTKGLRAGDRRYTRVADALLAFVPGLAERVAAEGFENPGDRRRFALECLNIFRNETPVDVLCWGRFALEKRGRRFDAPALHYELGEPCRLLLLHLRDARVATLEAERIVTIENETTFNDYIEWLRAQRREEIVLLSEGQANWAVVRLLRLLTEAAPGLPLEHWGDMDRFGILILRSLRRRTGLPIEPCWMDEATFTRCLPAGLPLPAGESKEIESLMASAPQETGAGLLRAIAAARVWIEQEAVASEVLR